MTLVRIVKDWDWPDLLRQTPGSKGEWDGINFTLDPVEECDYLIMLNNRMKEDIKVKCPPENIWALMQEPYVKGITDWVVEKHGPFSKVFTHHPLNDKEKYVVAPPAIPWHVDKTFDELIDSPVPVKTKLISWVVGDAKDIPGHILRWSFLNFLQKSDIQIDFLGRAVQYIEDKWDGLAPYYFSLAIENNSGHDMWTEKLADCFLSWTVPIYYGCKNLEKYFPKESFIKIDITEPETSLKIIKQNASISGWRLRLAGLEKARDLVLRKYQLFPFITDQVQKMSAKSHPKTKFYIPAYRRSLKAKLNRILYKLKKTLNVW